MNLKNILYFSGFALWKKVHNNTELISILQKRIVFSSICMLLLFLCISIRLFDIMIATPKQKTSRFYKQEEVARKVDIVDRNGEILATSIVTSSCYADPSVIFDTNDTIKKLSKVHGMPNADKLAYKLKDKSKHFVWLSRHVHPKIQNQIMDLGLPGIHFQKDYKRIYIHGSLFSHIIGCTDIDGNGVCGIERSTIKNPTNKKIVLGVDLRLQNIIHEELQEAINKYKAKGGNGILMKTNGEILAMVSLPDFDPNNLKQHSNKDMFNRNTLGVFEQGSILKVLTVAIALDSGSSSLGSIFDASAPIKIGRFSITDFCGKGRPLTLAEAFVFSSNIACAKIAQKFGIANQKKYFKLFGMLDKLSFEIPEVGAPIVPKDWTDITCMTLAYGYGIAISPLQVLTVITSITNGGVKIQPTLLLNNEQTINTRLVSQDTSALVRELMRGVILYGTAKKANIDDIEIFGKTGTAYKRKGRKGYGSSTNRDRLTTFIGGWPKDNPQYMLLVSLDSPQGISETHGYATAGWNVAPTAKNILNRLLPWVSNREKTKSTELKIIKYLNLLM